MRRPLQNHPLGKTPLTSNPQGLVLKNNETLRSLRLCGYEESKKINQIAMSMDNEFENEIEQEDTSSGLIERPFDPKKIDITTKQMILEVFFRRLRNNEIDMKTFFQRDSDLWGHDKQSRLIESILINLPLPAFYFDGSDDNCWLVVDGLQRLSAFKNFVVDKNLKLQSLEYLTDFNGRDFDSLPRELQRRIEEHEVTVYIINPGTPDDVKFNLFRRINTGGLVLSAQEIRNALNQGIPVAFINELASLMEFKRYKIKTRRMNDRDFVTRFAAFYMQPYSEYRPDLESFLNDAMKKIRQMPETDRKKMKGDFIKALDAAWEIFADDAFRKRYSPAEGRRPINKSLFEVWTVTLARLDDDELALLCKRKNTIKRKFVDLLNADKAFERAITSGTGEKTRVAKRFQEIEKIVEQTIND